MDMAKRDVQVQLQKIRVRRIQTRLRILKAIELLVLCDAVCILLRFVDREEPSFSMTELEDSAG